MFHYKLVHLASGYMLEIYSTCTIIVCVMIELNVQLRIGSICTTLVWVQFGMALVHLASGYMLEVYSTCSYDRIQCS